MDPIIEEILRAKTIQPHAFAKWRSYLRDVIQPQLDELAKLKAETPVPVRAK